MLMRDLVPIDYDHEVRAQYPNPIGTPQHHRIKTRRFKFSKKGRHHLTGQEGNATMAKSVDGKKTADEKAAAKKKAAPEKTTLGTKEVAAKLGVEPKFLRAVLRSNDRGSAGERYSWKPDDPLTKEKKLIADYQAKQEERKANAAKDAKKTPKKAAKKAAKKAKVEEEVEEEETEKAEEI